jgi:hypothetical protein
MASVFRDCQSAKFIDFPIEQRIILTQLIILKDWVKPAFRSKQRGRSVKGVCLLHDNAHPHTTAVAKGT